MLDMDLGELMGEVILSMREIAPTLGLEMKE